MRRNIRRALAALLLPAAAAAQADVAPPSLRCQLDLTPPTVTVSLTNTGTRALWFLAWNTPFERSGPWFGRWLELRRNGRPLAFGGPMVKRGEPARADYLELAAGASLHASADLAQVFAIGARGDYELRPALRLLDWGEAPLPWPRSRADLAGATELACNAASFRVP
ncbi:hypothetical protein [Derxia lacustris]|uniref:hypothetical protein n=1 Tax=Derxia lacustris TaxID=764842 RepID=UPI00111BF113|nr:hypothetical protein [Derxia lacustris]